MLSQQERREIDEELGEVERRSSGCIEALRVVQRHRRWVSNESIRDIADYLSMSVEEVDSVATFYNLIYRRPVGRHVILVCDSVSCWIMGYDRILDQLTSLLGVGLGQTTSDELFTLLPIACLGTCDHAPAMMIDDQLYQDLDPQRLESILQSYRE